MDAVWALLFTADKSLFGFTLEGDDIAAAFALNFHGAVDQNALEEELLAVGAAIFAQENHIKSNLRCRYAEATRFSSNGKGIMIRLCNK